MLCLSRVTPLGQAPPAAKERRVVVDDPDRSAFLLSQIRRDHVPQPGDFAKDFKPLDVDERELVRARTIRRVGQGTFRARLLDAHGRRCAITGERTEPVLDAAHIQPYLGPRSNHIRNGIVLSKDFPTLFDLGYVGIDPDYKVHVSPRLLRGVAQWAALLGVQRPAPSSSFREVLPRPSPAALEWHLGKVFLD